MSEASIFNALADSTRRALLVNLAENDAKTATQLAEEYPISRPGLIKHLNILKDAGLVMVQQEGREKRYTLRPEPLDELESWIQQLTAKWDARLLRLKNFIENEQITE